MHQETNKTILVIKSESANISTATAFLSKRDWNIKNCHRLQEAIQLIATEQPQFILVSIDHPNKNIRSFIKILMQSFPNRVIVFAEKPHVLTYHHFNEIGSQYNIYPPVSGPAVERTLLSYYKSQLGPGPSSVRIFKGPTFNKLHKNEYWAYTPPKKDIQTPVVLSAIKAKEILAIVEEGLTGNVDNKVQPDTAAGEVKTATSEGAPLGEVKSATSEASLGEITASNKKTPLGEVSAISTKTSQGEVSAKAAAPPTAGTVENKDPSAKEVGVTIAESKVVSGQVSVPNESLISRAAYEALEKSVHKVDVHNIEEIEIVSDMSCIIVESTRFSGYLIAAMGKNRELDAVFMEGLRQKIFKFLREYGEQVKEEDGPLRLTLQKVSFKKWASEEADFLRKSVHNQEEISIAFFPRKQIRVQFEDSHDEKMAKVKMEDIQPDVPVEFNLYIYLEENKRYVNYTKKGSKLLSAQKERLEKQGLKHMHVFKTDIPEFNKYRAQNFLNSKIDHFHSEGTKAAV